MIADSVRDHWKDFEILKINVVDKLVPHVEFKNKYIECILKQRNLGPA